VPSPALRKRSSFFQLNGFVRRRFVGFLLDCPLSSNERAKLRMFFRSAKIKVKRGFFELSAFCSPQHRGQFAKMTAFAFRHLRVDAKVVYVDLAKAGHAGFAGGKD
jgi:hypothetical protein